jgi:hypothetical protein
VSNATDRAASGTGSNHHTKDVVSMDWKLRVVPVPVSDVDRAKRFYSEQASFVVDLSEVAREIGRL